jgi:hypothetical protein
MKLRTRATFYWDLETVKIILEPDFEQKNERNFRKKSLEKYRSNG